MPVVNPITGLERLQLRTEYRPQSPCVYDDFLYGTTFGTMYTDSWASTTSGAGSTVRNFGSIVNDHPGIMEIVSGNGVNFAAMSMQSAPALLLPDGTLRYDAIVMIPDVSGCRFETGIADSTVTVNGSHVVSFLYNSTSGPEWLARVVNGPGLIHNTLIPVVSGTWYNLTILTSIASAVVSYYINDVLVATIDSTIPTGQAMFLMPGRVTNNGAGATRNALVDLVSYQIAFNGAR